MLPIVPPLSQLHSAWESPYTARFLQNGTFSFDLGKMPCLLSCYPKCRIQAILVEAVQEAQDSATAVTGGEPVVSFHGIINRAASFWS